MKLWLIGTLAFNVVVAFILLASAIRPGSHFEAPWDGPAIATLVLVASTVVLTGVAVLAALLAVWGFATLREHAGAIAKSAALEAMPKAAEAAAERVVRKWLNWPDDAASDQIAEAYGKE